MSTWSEPSRGWDDFEDWLADQVASHRLPISATPPGPPETLLTFQQDRLVGVPGTIEVLEQVSRPPMPRNFAPPGARTAAAVVEEGGERSFVLVREIDGQLQEIDGGPVGGRTLDQFVTESRAAYESGEGLL